MKKIFCCPALELFHCLPLWKTVLFVSSRAFLLSTPIFLFSTPVEKSEATWKKATKCNKAKYITLHTNIQKKLSLLHFVAFFHVASLFSTGVDNEKVGVVNEKALELTNSTFFHRGRQ